MASDIEKATDMLKELLADDKTRNKLGSLLGDLTTQSDDITQHEVIEAEITQEPDLPANLNMEGLLGGLAGGDKKRVALLSALRPYLSEKRSSKIDSAITLLKFAEMSSMMGINKLLK